MTIPLVTSPGGIFRRIGRIAYLLNSLNGWRGTADLSAAGAVSLGTGIDNITGQYAASNQALVDGLYSQRDQLRNTLGGFPFTLSFLASNTLTKMVDDDTVVSSRTLSACLPVLIAQMVANGETVNANTVSVSTATGSGNTGTAVIVASLKNAAGVLQEYALAEVLTATCTTDAQSGSASAGSEVWSITGELPALTGSLGWDWPAGSGASASLRAKTAATGLLDNGDFESWTVTNVPDDWTILVGTAGTTVFESTSIVYAGVGALRILGNGSELTSLTQSVTLKPSTVYALNCFHRVSAVPSGGALSIDLFDGSGVITDAAGTNNAVTKALTASTTSFAALNGTFRTPAVLPATVKLRVRLTTALESGKSVYIDELCLTPATQVYPGGPFVAIFAGATNSVKADSFTVTVANDWGGKIQKAFEQMFGMRDLGLQLPSNGAGAETIPDSLVY